MRAAPLLIAAWLCAGAPALAQDTSGTAIRELPSRGGPIDESTGGPDHGRRPPRRIQLFISPAGEPFRAKLGAPYPSAVWFAQANISHDGKLTREQFVADALAFFTRLDANHDGIVDGFEIQDYEQKVAPEILPSVGRLNAEDAGYGRDAVGIGRQAGSPRRRDGGGGAPRARKGMVSFDGAAPYELINEPEPVLGADADFDGRVSLEEFRKAAGERFDLLDSKKKGYLTLEGLTKPPVQQLAEQAEAERIKREKNHPKPAPRADGD